MEGFPIIPILFLLFAIFSKLNKTSQMKSQNVQRHELDTGNLKMSDRKIPKREKNDDIQSVSLEEQERFLSEQREIESFLHDERESGTSQKEFKRIGSSGLLELLGSEETAQGEEELSEDDLLHDSKKDREGKQKNKIYLKKQMFSDRELLKKAFVMKEILDKPMSLRR